MRNLLHVLTLNTKMGKITILKDAQNLKIQRWPMPRQMSSVKVEYSPWYMCCWSNHRMFLEKSTIVYSKWKYEGFFFNVILELYEYNDYLKWK